VTVLKPGARSSPGSAVG